MFWEMSWKTLKRSKKKSILLGLLLVLIIVFTILGYSMFDNCNYLLKQAKEEYTTIGVVEYTAGKYPDDTQITEKSKAILEKFDKEKIRKSKNVLSYQEPYVLQGYTDQIKGSADRDSLFFYNSIIVFRVTYKCSDGNFRCTLVDPYYSNDAKEGTTFGLSREVLRNTEDYDIQLGHLYIANGDFRGEGNLRVFSLAAKLGLDEGKDNSIQIKGFPLVDITDNPDYLKTNVESKEWEKIRDYYQVQNKSTLVKAIHSIKEYPEFYLGSSVIAKGRMWTDEESKRGDKVCVINAAIAEKTALKVGDQLHLQTHFSDDSAHFYDSYKTETGFKEDATFKIIGVYQKVNDTVSPYIFVPQNSLKQLPKNQVRYNIESLTLENGTGTEFQNAMDKQLNDHFTVSVFDQGYEQTVAPIKAMRLNAILIMILCGCCSIVVLILFGIIFVVKQKETIAIMTSLGTGKKNILSYILSGSVMIGGLSAIVGGLSAFFLSKVAVQFAYEMVKNVHHKDTRYSILAMGKQHIFSGNIRSSLLVAAIISLVVMVAVIMVCMIDALKVIEETRNFGGQSQKKRKRKTKTYKTKKAFQNASFEHLDIQLTESSFSKKRQRRFMFFTSKKSLFLNRRVNCILVLTSLCISIFMVSYSQGIQEYRNMIDQAYKEIEVNASFRTVGGNTIPTWYIPGTVRGYMESASNVKMAYHSTVNKYDYIGLVEKNSSKDKDTSSAESVMSDRLNRAMAYPKTAFAMEEKINSIRNMSNICFVDDIARAEEFFREGKPKIEFLKGYENMIENPVKDGENLALDPKIIPMLHAVATEDFLKTNQLQLGDIVMVAHILIDGKGESYIYEPLKCKIVGSYLSKMDGETIYISNREIERKIVRTDIKDQMYTSDINYKLQKTDDLCLLKDKLKAEKIEPVGIWSATRVSFVIEDAQLVETVNSYENGMSFMMNLRYILFILIFMIGFISTYLAMRSRIQEMAIMRSLGTGTARVFFIFFLEQIILAVVGAVLGIVISLLYYKGIGIQQLGMVGVFVLFFMGGSVISILQMNQKNVLKILSTAE